MGIYKTQSMRVITTGAELAHGGQGSIQEIIGDSRSVAKLYNTANKSKEQENKLKVMIANPPSDDSLNQSHRSLAWPTDLIYENSNFVGFIMPRIGKWPHIFELFNPQLRQKQFPTVTRRDLHRIGINLASAFNNIHRAGYVIGDVNQKNILVTDQSLVIILDTDSFQVTDRNGKKYLCPVGVPEYTPPEIQGIHLSTVNRTTKQDCFGLAILIFELLMEGIHPFMGVPKNRNASTSFILLIKAGAFAYQPNIYLVPAPHSPSFDILYPDIQKLFIRCFVDGHNNPDLRPTPYEWVNALTLAERNLIKCPKGHWYSNHLGICPYCAQTKQIVVPLPQIQNPPQPSIQKQSRGWPKWAIPVGLLGLLVISILIFNSHNPPPIQTPVYSSPTQEVYVSPTDNNNQPITAPIVPAQAPTEPERKTCGGAPPIRIEVGDVVEVININDNRYNVLDMRLTPIVGTNISGGVGVGTKLQVLDGPVCSNDVSFFKVRDLDNGNEGWVAEAEADTKNYYLSQPLY